MLERIETGSIVEVSNDKEVWFCKRLVYIIPEGYTFRYMTAETNDSEVLSWKHCRSVSIKEVTLEEIAEKFNVPVDKIRIKD